MLGIQQTHAAVPHHPSTRSAATAVSSGPLRSATIPKRRPNGVQKHHVLDTVSTTQDNPETQVETSAENSAWSEPPRIEHVGVEQKDDVNEVGSSSEQAEERKRSVDPSANQEQDANGSAEQEKKDEREGVDSKPDGVEDYMRRPSSPLSELSPAPDEDDNPTQGEGADEDEGSEKAASSYNLGRQHPIDGLPDSVSSVPASSDTRATTRTGQNAAYHGFSGNAINQAAPMNPFGSDIPTVDGFPGTSTSLGSSSQLPYSAGVLPSPSPGKQGMQNARAGPSGSASPSSAKADTTRKFSILLELNAELLRVFQAFISSGYPQEAPEAQLFSKRLDNNLTWMIMHVDNANKAHAGRPSIPDIDPPVLAPSAAHIAFPEGIFDRINRLYALLTSAFAKDIARRNQLLASSSNSGMPNIVQQNSLTPSILPPSGIGVKRERPDSSGYSRMESPSAPKRRDTGEGKEMMGPSTPTRSASLGVGDMPPPTTPRFPTPSHPQMIRPGSGMSGVGPTNASGHSDGMFSPSTSSGLNMSGSTQGLGNVGGLSPEAQARARQMQMQQVQAFMLQQQQLQLQQQQGQQHPQTNQQIRTQSINVGMGSPQRLSQGTPSPTRQQQLMQAQAAARQMSPPAATPGLGAGMGMGMNGSDSMGSGQQGGMGSNVPQASMSANVNGMGTNSGSNMTQGQMLASMGPAAVATYQALQNAQHPITQYLNQQMPNFSQLPVMEQMRRFQIVQRQMSQRNQMMANQMMGGQMRQSSISSSGSGTPQMQQLGQSGQLGVAPHMQSSASENNMQFPNTPTAGNMSGAASSMSMPQLGNISGMPNVSNLNPQQRQLYLMQMQMRNAGVGGGNLSNSSGMGGGMNPALVNPQLLQERQRLEQQQRLALTQRHGSPLNPASSSGSGHFPPGLRSNPTPSVGIARTGRSPSVSGLGDMAGGATPRIGGRMLPGSEDYQRQVLIQQAQRSAQMQQQQQQQQQSFMQGQGQGSWSGQQPQQLPLSAGAWPQQAQQGFGMGNSSPNTGMPGVDFMTPSRQTSATPAPMGHQSPTAPSTDFDNMMNW